MTEKLFSFHDGNYLECQNAFRGKNNQEYYLADYKIDGESDIDVQADKKAVGACSIIRLQSKSRLFFRRSWSHIQQDATDVTVFWFVKRGSVCVTHSTGVNVANEGEFGITRSMLPFSLECCRDGSGMHELLHVVVPSHVFRRFIPADICSGFSTPMRRREFRIAESMFTELLDDTEALTERVEKLMIDGAMSIMSEGIRQCDNALLERVSLSQKRRQEVLRYIEIHFSDPNINAEMVAQGCGISRRYLSHLLQTGPAGAFERKPTVLTPRLSA